MQAASPAIDRGSSLDAPDSDYDGTTRPQSGGIDIGAFEFPSGPEAVDEYMDSIPKTFELFQNYPNPFNPQTTIRFAVPQRTTVILKLYDLLGREVTTLVDEEMTAGDYQIVFNAESLSSVVYFYRIHAGGFVQSKKLVIMR